MAAELAASAVKGPERTATTQKALADLESLAERSRRILEDPRKQRWHQDTRNQLALIEAEMERLKGRAAHH